jgi:hypothetical protein
MYSRTLLARVERAEQLAKTKTKFSPDCICWPENELPFFGFNVEREIAAGVECPVHGKRSFWRLCHLYIPKWLRENQQKRLSRRSPQYQKAWNASFPPELWPAEEEETKNGDIFLRLKDGTRLLAYESGHEKAQQRDRTVGAYQKPIVE